LNNLLNSTIKKKLLQKVYMK